MRTYKIVTIVSALFLMIIPLAIAAEPEEKNLPPWVLHNTLSKLSPKNEGWLADLTGLPNIDQIERLSLYIDNIMKREKDKRCAAVNPRLRKMIFLHFMVYQHMVNKRSVYLTKKNAHHWAHVFGMLLKESSGDPTNITSMSGRSYTTYDAKSDLDRWRKIAKLSKNGSIPLNYQTNFGLTQLSVDRLFVALQLARAPAHLIGEQSQELNTAIAVRRLIWFYQDFAQGRLTQAHDRIHHHETGNPEYSARFAFGASMALLLCGTNYMFYEGYHGKASDTAELTQAISSIAYCKIGDDTKGYGKNESNEKCFAEWVTLCPNLNFDIAMITPLKYFATRHEPPVCEDTFNLLRFDEPISHPKVSEKKSNSHHSKNLPSTPHAPFDRLKKLLRHFLQP